MQDEEKHRQIIKQTLRESFGFLPKYAAVVLGVGVVITGPIFIGRFCGDGWGLFAAIISIGIWLCGIKLWFFSTIRFVWFVGLVGLVFFAVSEATRLFH
ncbi:MAG TPA: hypothetical protein VG167_21235 [Verrucomicrobiae bacterium]|nr:hypothetical protein [Verrucomicrobiae bacterium]